MKNKLSHVDSSGRARMVDVSAKAVTLREAVAEGSILLRAQTLRAIARGAVPKGDVLSVARTAGIMAAKECGRLIPLCHPLGVEAVSVEFELPARAANGKPARLGIRATARISAKTGVEMEALTAVAVSALTIYDMCKAIDKTMVISDIHLVKKTGGANVIEPRSSRRMRS